MYKITGTFEFNSNSSLDNIKDRIQVGLTAIGSLHEHNDPAIQIASVQIKEVVVTLNPVVDSGFFVDTMTLR